MKPDQISAATTGILFTISVITGCLLPTDQVHQQVLERECIKFILENKALSTLTIEEVLSAFRLNAAGKLGERVKHFNNVFNLDYLGEVLFKWVDLRNIVEQKLEVEELKSLPQLPVENVSPEEIVQISRDIYEPTKNWKLISHNAYKIFSDQDKIKLTEEERSAIKKKATAAIDELALFDSDLFKEIPRDTLHHRFCKKIAVAQYFDFLKAEEEKAKKEVSYGK